jgi:formylglycine-generating enzyme required for sulfatase activity
MRWAFRIVAALVVLAAGMGNAQAPAPKLALVIGVSDYARALTPDEVAAGFVVPKPLPNAVRDATLVADALEAQGFTVTRLADPDKRAMLAGLSNFSTALTRAGPDAVGVFYFAGHGAQGRPALERDIDNYLIPRNTALISEVDLESEALALSRVSATLKPAPRGAMVLILDACRDFALPAANRSGASPGSTALDGPAGGNGPYARALAAEVRGAQGATLEQVFISVRNKVLAETRDTQLPWENSSLRRSVTLGVTPISMTAAIDRSELPAPPAPKTRPGETFKECDVCPEMSVLPAGAFVMGSPATELEHASDEAQHPVTIPRPFAVGQFEVTFAQWDACVAAGGCAPPEEGPYSPPDQSWGRDNRPVMNVSWQDAKRYVRFLNGRVGGKAYRLLTEAEWEYAARAGTTTAFSTGATIAPTQAQYAHNRAYAGSPVLASGPGKTAPVGSFPANAFKLHDMHGNVWEWVEDCYVADNAALTREGAANTTQGCSSRVLRGGSWYSDPQNLRSADRYGYAPTYRIDYLGFRVARTVFTP